MGNQLFQLAAAALLRERARAGVELILDSLVRYEVPRAPDSLRLAGARWVRDAPILREGLVHALVNAGRAGRWLPGFGVSDANFWERLRARPRRYYALDGYFQQGWTQASLSHAIDLLEVDLHPASGDECIVHVRGGDFLRHAEHNILTAEFYGDALDRARAAGCTGYSVLTDDPDHARRILSDVGDRLGMTQTFLASSPDPLDDFRRLANARLRVIGNSTFAWWATAVDRCRGRTYSPARFARSRARDCFLDWETALPIEGFS